MTTINIRSIFLPNPGYSFVELDLKQADAQVVAWESDDTSLKNLFGRGIDIYTETETKTWNNITIPRQIRKNCIHSANYGGGYKTIAERYLGSERDAKQFLDNWFHHHPNIRKWQRRIEFEMKISRTPTIHNIWGYRRVYACPTPITQALAWIGQSTVAITINHIMKWLSNDDTDCLVEPPAVFYRSREVLRELRAALQIHDSVLMQVPNELCPQVFPLLLELAQVKIPYKPHPLTIPCELKWFPQSWGFKAQPNKLLEAAE